MPSFHVVKSKVIDQPIDLIKSSLCDFKQWRRWSPWLIMEQDATLIYNDKQGQEGATYAWSGILVGAGSMVITDIMPREIHYKLSFVKPFKSEAKVVFEFVQTSDGTEVVWHMYGNLPWWMFWMTKMMKSYIGMDYERGLMMLKEYLETGDVASHVVILGEMEIEEQTYIGIPHQCSIDEMPSLMKQDFERLMRFMEDHQITLDGIPFSIYNTFDLMNNTTDFVSCIPFKGDMELPSGFISSTLPSARVLKTKHTGRYEHLGNAWSTAFNFVKMKKIKLIKKPMGIEFYLNDPQDTAPEDLICEICLPLK